MSSKSACELMKVSYIGMQTIRMPANGLHTTQTFYAAVKVRADQL